MVVSYLSHQEDKRKSPYWGEGRDPLPFYFSVCRFYILIVSITFIQIIFSKLTDNLLTPRFMSRTFTFKILVNLSNFPKFLSECCICVMSSVE